MAERRGEEGGEARRVEPAEKARGEDESGGAEKADAAAAMTVLLPLIIFLVGPGRSGLSCDAAPAPITGQTGESLAVFAHHIALQNQTWQDENVPAAAHALFDHLNIIRRSASLTRESTLNLLKRKVETNLVTLRALFAQPGVIALFNQLRGEGGGIGGGEAEGAAAAAVVRAIEAVATAEPEHPSPRLAPTYTHMHPVPLPSTAGLSHPYHHHYPHHIQLHDPCQPTSTAAIAREDLILQHHPHHNRCPTYSVTTRDQHQTDGGRGTEEVDIIVLEPLAPLGNSPTPALIGHPSSRVQPFTAPPPPSLADGQQHQQEQVDIDVEFAHLRPDQFLTITSCREGPTSPPPPSSSSATRLFSPRPSHSSCQTAPVCTTPTTLPPFSVFSSPIATLGLDATGAAGPATPTARLLPFEPLRPNPAPAVLGRISNATSSDECTLPSVPPPPPPPPPDTPSSSGVARWAHPSFPAPSAAPLSTPPSPPESAPTDPPPPPPPPTTPPASAVTPPFTTTTTTTTATMSSSTPHTSIPEPVAVRRSSRVKRCVQAVPRRDPTAAGHHDTAASSTLSPIRPSGSGDGSGGTPVQPFTSAHPCFSASNPLSAATTAEAAVRVSPRKKRRAGPSNQPTPASSSSSTLPCSRPATTVSSSLAAASSNPAATGIATRFRPCRHSRRARPAGANAISVISTAPPIATTRDQRSPPRTTAGAPITTTSRFRLPRQALAPNASAQVAYGPAASPISSTPAPLLNNPPRASPTTAPQNQSAPGYGCPCGQPCAYYHQHSPAASIHSRRITHPADLIPDHLILSFTAADFEGSTTSPCPSLTACNLCSASHLGLQMVLVWLGTLLRTAFVKSGAGVGTTDIASVAMTAQAAFDSSHRRLLLAAGSEAHAAASVAAATAAAARLASASSNYQAPPTTTCRHHRPDGGNPPPPPPPAGLA